MGRTLNPGEPQIILPDTISRAHSIPTTSLVSWISLLSLLTSTAFNLLTQFTMSCSAFIFRRWRTSASSEIRDEFNQRTSVFLQGNRCHWCLVPLKVHRHSFLSHWDANGSYNTGLRGASSRITISFSVSRPASVQCWMHWRSQRTWPWPS